MTGCLPRGAASLLCILFASLAVACGDKDEKSSPCGDTEGTVKTVVDGDTVVLADGRKIRYLLTDTTELSSGDCFSEEGRTLNEQLVLGKDVTLEYDDKCTDMFGRTLAYVYVDGRMVNEILIERGYAKVLYVAPNDKYKAEFEALEAAAKANGAGMWGVCQ